MGGLATYYQSLLNSSLPQHVDLCFVETSSQKRTGAKSGLFTFSNLLSALNDCGRFAKAVIKHRPQLTHIATANGLSFVKNSVCIIIARLSGSRVLLHPHCGFPALYSDQSRWWKWFVRQIIRLTNGVITLSTEWNQLSSIVPGCRVYYLPNAIDLSDYREIGLEHTSKIRNPSRLKVLFLGYIGRQKGSFDLIEAARITASRKMPLIFDLVGEESAPGELEQLKKQVEQTGLEHVVTFHPTVWGTGKYDFFREADIFIYPSYSEGMPIAVIEAMAAGLPVIVTRVGGMPDLVSDGFNGLLIEAGRADQIVDALEILSSKPELRLAMQLNGFKKAFKNYDIENHVPRLVSIYNAGLTGKSL